MLLEHVFIISDVYSINPISSLIKNRCRQQKSLCYFVIQQRTQSYLIRLLCDLFFYEKEIIIKIQHMTQISQAYTHRNSPFKSEPDTQTDQNQQTLISQLKQNKERSKLKSSLCKNFVINGFCPYGDRCQFAHGAEQLRCNASLNTSYKTKHCFSFIKKGICPYGNRCNFIHSDPNAEKVWVGTALVENFPEFLTVSSREESKLLSIITKTQ